MRRFARVGGQQTPKKRPWRQAFANKDQDSDFIEPETSLDKIDTSLEPEAEDLNDQEDEEEV